MSDHVLALDIGGTKVAAALVDGAGRLTHLQQRPTPHGDAEALWAVIAALVSDVRGAGSVAAVGVASAGPVDIPAGTISPINIAGVRGFPVIDRVAELTGLPVHLGGDGLCMAMGESRAGAGRGAPVMLGLGVCTRHGGGRGGGGIPYHGRTGNAGHVGHVVVDADGQPCSCGGRGCVETVASGPNLVR